MKSISVNFAKQKWQKKNITSVIYALIAEINMDNEKINMAIICR